MFCDSTCWHCGNPARLGWNQTTDWAAHIVCDLKKMLWKDFSISLNLDVFGIFHTATYLGAFSRGLHGLNNLWINKLTSTYLSQFCRIAKFTLRSRCRTICKTPARTPLNICHKNLCCSNRFIYEWSRSLCYYDR